MNAQKRIEDKESQILYKKVGRKYVPINDPWAYDGLRAGYWLVKVSHGCTSIRASICPAKAELQAAIKDKEDQIVEVIRKASEARPKSITLTQRQRDDWNAFIRKHGESFNTLEYPSMQENAENILKILLEK